MLGNVVENLLPCEKMEVWMVFDKSRSIAVKGTGINANVFLEEKWKSNLDDMKIWSTKLQDVLKEV
eukprot:Pgem_evm1s16298